MFLDILKKHLKSCSKKLGVSMYLLLNKIANLYWPKIKIWTLSLFIRYRYPWPTVKSHYKIKLIRCCLYIQIKISEIRKYFFCNPYPRCAKHPGESLISIQITSW